MKKNIGNIDAVIRVDIAFILAFIFYSSNESKSILMTIGLLFAGYLLATAVFGTDPLYKLPKLSTVGIGESKKPKNECVCVGDNCDC
jgi:hypothetical protein